MAWTVITEDHVLSLLNAAERDAAATIALAPGQTAPLPNIIQWAMDEVRGVVKTQMQPEATGVPPSLVIATLDIIIYRLMARVSVIPELLKSRKDAFDDAEAKLKDVVDGKFKVSDDSAALSGVPTSNYGSSVLPQNVRTITRQFCEGM